ncbi:MAG TPA: hypothetical protein VGG36_10405 [Rhizomicrobium sp.]|jgi:hypothetical protein
MSRALHIRPLVGDHIAPKKPAKALKQRPKPKLALVPKDAPRATTLTERAVEVFDRDGHLIEVYSVVLEDADCHEAEFEEVALIFAEQSGRVVAEEIVHLRARCV